MGPRPSFKTATWWFLSRLRKILIFYCLFRCAFRSFEYLFLRLTLVLLVAADACNFRIGDALLSRVRLVIRMLAAHWAHVFPGGIVEGVAPGLATLGCSGSNLLGRGVVSGLGERAGPAGHCFRALAVLGAGRSALVRVILGEVEVLAGPTRTRIINKRVHLALLMWLIE